ncbi:cell envelope integrity protein TolA [Salinibius halmophilus]|uniref:cell envelope integrity protein TolA n=1 Tax=Salinibius halmophilus TaxID=1853216 RepID=UPI000E674617|nr:cell envelope integrity protein TolA [Salinibius halmophilus]
MRLIWPTIQALLLHIVVAIVLVWTFDVSPAVKEFDLSSPAIEWVELPPAPQPEPQPVQQPAPEPEPAPEQDRAAELALKEKQEAERREREAQQRREAEAQRQREAERRQREEQARKEREAQEAAERQAEQEQREREQEQRDRERRIEAEQQRLAELREQRLAEMQSRLEAEQAANEQAQQAQASRQASEVESFVAGIRMQIQRQWRRPASANNDMQVLLLIDLLPTGELRNVSILQSSGDRLFDRSAITAVESVTRFSVPKDPNMFEQNFRSLNLLFDPEDLF